VRSGTDHVGSWARRATWDAPIALALESVESLTWLVSLGCALQVAIGAATPLLEDPIFETSCHEDKSFKFWLVRAASDVHASLTP
jgi:hypothetical protein